MSAGKILKLLWEHTKPSDLSDHLLNQLDIGEECGDALSRYAMLMRGVGCLVLADDDKAGNFQGGDVPDLLFALADAVEAAGEAMTIASDAKNIRLNRSLGSDPEYFGRKQKAKGASHG